MLIALTMLSFFEGRLIILLRRSLFTAEFIRAFFQSSRWFKIYKKFRVKAVGRSYKVHHNGAKALAVVQPSCRGYEPPKGPGGTAVTPPVPCCCVQAPASCSPLPLPASCQAEEGTVPKHLYLSFDPPQMPKNVLQCSVSYH